MKRSSYAGLTYPSFLEWKIWRKTVIHLWRKFLCTRNIHMLDECESLEHYLHCDACGLRVHIAYIETEEEARERAKLLHFLEPKAIERSETDPYYNKDISYGSIIYCE